VVPRAEWDNLVHVTRRLLSLHSEALNESRALVEFLKKELQRVEGEKESLIDVAGC
jgi:hypothetical protein